MSAITTRAEAEALGWRFEHEAAEETIVTSSTQGRTRTVPATIVAEKIIDQENRPRRTVHEQAENEQQLFAQITAYEAHLASLVNIGV